MVAVIAHALGAISRDVFGKDCDPCRLPAIALYHDASEIITGDLPTPVKYNSAEIEDAYKKIEENAENTLLDMLPQALKNSFTELFCIDEGSYDAILCKAADRLSAYIKCIEERKTGNMEFLSAERQTLDRVLSMNLPEVDYFIKNFIPAFEKNLDELGIMR